MLVATVDGPLVLVKGRSQFLVLFLGLVDVYVELKALFLEALGFGFQFSIDLFGFLSFLAQFFVDGFEQLDFFFQAVFGEESVFKVLLHFGGQLCVLLLELVLDSFQLLLLARLDFLQFSLSRCQDSFSVQPSLHQKGPYHGLDLGGTFDFFLEKKLGLAKGRVAAATSAKRGSRVVVVLVLRTGRLRHSNVLIGAHITRAASREGGVELARRGSVGSLFKVILRRWKDCHLHGFLLFGFR